jgi:2-polyprenyl-3-methyl-5-hydroxy-6-metoxy-1,4-benzoquinol methylase
VTDLETSMLEEKSGFYEKGDLMDYLLIDRCGELIIRHCRTRGNALEIGCGEGYSTILLADHFDGLEVLDASTKNIELMRKRTGKDLTCHITLLEDFNPVRKYDNIFFMHVLEHVLDPIASLRKLESMLSDEGQIYIAVPNCMALNRRAGYLMGMLPGYETLAPKDLMVGHRRLYTVDMLAEHCSLAGLKVMTMKGIYLKPLSEAQMYALQREALMAFYRLGEDVPQYCADIFAVACRKYF